MKNPKNKYKVSASQWKKWSCDQQSNFNTLFPALRHQEYFNYGGVEIPKKQWDTIAWNIAFTLVGVE